MSSETLVSMSEAAKMVGLTRPTFYRKVKELGITTVNEDGKKQVDVSELIRVFGTDVKLNNEGRAGETKKSISSKVSKSLSSGQGSAEDNDLRIQLAVMEAELEKEKQRNEEIKEQVDYLKDQISLEKAEKNKLTLFLEDQRDKESKGEQWERHFKALENRITNQEKASQKDREERQRILQQNKALKKALQEEKNKAFWQRLFG